MRAAAGVAAADGVVYRQMLFQQRVSCARLRKQQQPILHHAVGEQAVAGTQRVQQDDVVRAFAHRIVEFHVDRGFLAHVAQLMRGLHALDDALQQRPVVGSRAARRVVGRHTLDVAAVFQIVACRLGVGRDQFQHRRREDLADEVGDMRSAAMLRHQQSTCFENLQRRPQDWPRHLELPCQFAFARQPVADPQDAFEDQALDLEDHLVGGARMLYPRKYRAQGTVPEYELKHRE